jgi:hypothetical protein
MYPHPGGLKTCGFCGSRSRSPTLMEQQSLCSEFLLNAKPGSECRFAQNFLRRKINKTPVSVKIYFDFRLLFLALFEKHSAFRIVDFIIIFKFDVMLDLLDTVER